MTEMINRIGERLVTKMTVVNLARENKEYWDDNIRTNPHYSEFHGMLQLLKTMDFEFEIDWNPENIYEMTAITIMGKRFEVRK